MKTLISGGLISVIFMLVACGGMPTKSMNDTAYGLLRSVPVEVIYIEPQYPLQLDPPYSVSAGQAVGMMFGAIGGAIAGAMDGGPGQKAIDEAQKALEPYGSTLDSLNLRESLFQHIQSKLKSVPGLAAATFTRLLYGTTIPSPHDLALHSSAKEVIIVSPDYSLFPDGSHLGLGVAFKVFVKPHPDQAVEYDSYNAWASVPSSLKPADKSTLDAYLKQWFANNGAELTAAVGTVTKTADDRLDIYFHMPVTVGH